MNHCFAAVVCMALAAGVPPAEVHADEIEVSYDRSAEVARVSVPVEDGRVRWGDLLRGVARARGFDDRAWEDTGSERSVPVTGLRGRAFLAGINHLFGPGVRLEIWLDEGSEDGTAELTLDRRTLLATERRLKQRLKHGAQLLRPGQRQYGLTFDDGWENASPERTLVILIHGLQSTSEKIDGVLPAVRKLGHPCATFDYPNDQPVDESAALLAEELARLAADHPERNVTLLTHSMGGLVARAVIEDESRDPGNVTQLIMVAPPNHGSLLAHLAFGFDFLEYLNRDRDRDRTERFFATIEDGLGEAPDDLRTTSPFLERLNRQPRNPNVRYTILLGTEAPLSKTSLAGLRRSLKKAGTRNRYARFLGSKLDTYLADLDEVVEGKGDGAVAVKRGRLEGVSDIEVLPFDHLDFSGPYDSPGAERIRNAILERLR